MNMLVKKEEDVKNTDHPKGIFR